MLRRSFGKAVLLGSAAGLANSAVWSQSPPLRKVAINFGLTYVPISSANLFAVPQAMGFWRDEGLDVQVQLANGVGSAVQQLIANQVVASFGGLPPTMTLINKGAPIVVAASLNGNNVYYPVALASSRVKSPSDMKGANIGITSASSSNVFFIRAMLLRAGLNPDKDVTMISVGAGPAAIQALTSGRIDVLQLYESAYDQIEHEGHPLRRFNNVPGFNDLTFTFGMTVRTDAMKADRDMLVRVFRGMVKGTVYAHAHPEDVVRMHWKVFPLSKPQGISEAQAMDTQLAVLKSSLKNSLAATQGKFGEASMASVAAMRDTMKHFGLLDTALPEARYYDPSIVKAANDFDHDAVRALPVRA